MIVNATALATVASKSDSRQLSRVHGTQARAVRCRRQRIGAVPLLALLLLTPLLGLTAGCSEPQDEVRTPTQFMQAFATALQESQLGELWQALPPSYQSDLTRVVQKDFPKIHPETWQHVVSMGEDLERLLTDRREILLQSILVVQNDSLKTLIREHGDATAALLKKLRTGSLATPSQWATLDVSSWVAGDLSEALRIVVIFARELIPQFGAAYDQLANNKIVILKEEPHRILVQLQAPGAAPQEQFFVRVENTWILQSFTLSWEDGLEKLSESLDSLSEPNSAASRELAERAEAFAELAQAPDTQAFDAIFVKLLGE